LNGTVLPTGHARASKYAKNRIIPESLELNELDVRTPERGDALPEEEEKGAKGRGRGHGSRAHLSRTPASRPAPPSLFARSPIDTLVCDSLTRRELRPGSRNGRTVVRRRLRPSPESSVFKFPTSMPSARRRDAPIGRPIPIYSSLFPYNSSTIGARLRGEPVTATGTASLIPEYSSR